MKRSKSFDNLLTDLHSDPLPDAVVPGLSLHTDGVAELSPLNKSEQDRLATCEKIIDEGFSTFVAVGNALLEIRRDKLYRSSYRTFEAYCRDRFQIKRQRAYELMGAAEVVNGLSEISDKVNLPERESHANALSSIPEQSRSQVWQQLTKEAQRTGKPVTAKAIKAVIEQQAEDPIKSGPMSAKAQKDHVHRLRKALAQARQEDIRIEVKGEWLVRHGLEEVWRGLRNRPDWVINALFTDVITLQEAQKIGLIK